jgi:hypothetical protein
MEKIGHSGYRQGLDRRTADRFPINAEIKYRVVERQASGARQEGVGMTLNMSRGGVQFTTGEHVPAGRLVELAVNWPARLNGTCALQLVATGHVVRSTPQAAVVRIERYEFKTRKG